MSRSVRRRLSRLVAPAFEPLARRRLQAISRQATTDEEIVDIAFDFSLGGVNIRPYQVRSELLQFIELVRLEAPGPSWRSGQRMEARCSRSPRSVLPMPWL